VGLVREKLIDENGVPELRVMIEQDYRSTLRTTSRFWSLPATSMKFGQHGFKLDVQGVDALVQGALAFDHFDKAGMKSPMTHCWNCPRPNSLRGAPAALSL
jgi:paraquat-inducible protein B